jgi:hypothetical protein
VAWAPPLPHLSGTEVRAIARRLHARAAARPPQVNQPPSPPNLAREVSSVALSSFQQTATALQRSRAEGSIAAASLRLDVAARWTRFAVAPRVVSCGCVVRGRRGAGLAAPTPTLIPTAGLRRGDLLSAGLIHRYPRAARSGCTLRAGPPLKTKNLALSERPPLGIVRPLGVVGIFSLAPHGAAE